MTAGTEAAPQVGAPRWVPGLVAASIVLVALNLRPAVVGVGPLLTQIRTDVGLTATAAGVLTALPVLCFGLLAPVAPRVARRIGIERALLAALAVLIVGCAVRMVPAIATLYAGTALIGTAIASGNVLLPALVKRDFAHRTGVMTAVYSTSISLGGAMGAAVTVPLADAAGLGWRVALGAWGLFALLALLCWIPQLRRVGRPSTPGLRIGGLARQALAWQVTVYMGLQSLGFYATTAWLPAVFVDRGYSAAAAGVLVAIMSLTGILGAMSAPVLATRFADQRLLTLGVTVVGAAGLGLVVVPGAELAGTIVLGVAQGGALGLALTFMALRAPDAPHAAKLSGMAQCLGYTMAAAGPFAVGALHDLTGGWTVPLVVLLVLLLPQAVAGMLAGRARQLAPRG